MCCNFKKGHVWKVREKYVLAFKNSGEVLSKLKDIGYQATSLFTHDFSTLYTTLPHNLIKEKLLDLIELTFYKKKGKLYLACNDKKAFVTSANHYRGYHLWSCQNVCDALPFLLDNIYIKFCTKLYRQIIGIPIGTNCTPLLADLFLFCYEEISWKIFLVITRSTLLRHST